MRIASKLAGIDLLDWAGDRERLGTFWTTQLLPFTRETEADRRALWQLCERMSVESAS